MSNLILSNKADVKSKICVIISSKLYSKAKEKGSYYITDKRSSFEVRKNLHFFILKNIKEVLIYHNHCHSCHIQNKASASLCFPSALSLILVEWPSGSLIMEAYLGYFPNAFKPIILFDPYKNL